MALPTLIAVFIIALATLLLNAMADVIEHMPHFNDVRYVAFHSSRNEAHHRPFYMPSKMLYAMVILYLPSS